MNFIGKQCLKLFKNDITSPSYLYTAGKTYGYKSAFSLDKLYPTSNLKLYTPSFVPEDPSAQFTGFIPIDKLNITYSRSGGPGGQNVNKVNTKVDVRFNVNNATWLSQEIRDKLVEQNQTKINKEGELIIRSDLTRSQQLNLADALEKLRALIRKTLEPPPTVSEESKEKHRKLQLKAARERLLIKRRNSQIKQDRRDPYIDMSH